MDWFERLFGFREDGYADTQTRFEVDGAILRSKANGSTFGIGAFEMASLASLRDRVAAGTGAEGKPRISIVRGDVRKMHQMPEYQGALFQVASQFNALEMVGPGVSPESGVTRYEHDRTQGPACALAAGAALVYRNFLVPFPDGSHGQTSGRQLDGLADLGAELSRALNTPVDTLWEMINGYCLCTSDGLARIAEHLHAVDAGPASKPADNPQASGPDPVDTRTSLPDADSDPAGRLARLLRIGLQFDVEVTDGARPGPSVNQAFCSALPVSYDAPSKDLLELVEQLKD